MTRVGVKPRGRSLNDAINATDHVVSNVTMITEYKIRKCVKGNTHAQLKAGGTKENHSKH